MEEEKLREKYSLSIEDKVILFVAADTKDERKGIKYILDIIPNCNDYTFISIGKKIENFEFNNFIQLGYISDRAKINEIYYMSDVFVIPSLDDNFPTTVLEAFANSTPVVGFNIGGIPEQVSNEVGIIVDKIESSSLKKSISDIINNNIERYSINAQKKYLSNYTMNTFCNRYLKIYKEMVGHNIE